MKKKDDNAECLFDHLKKYRDSDFYPYHMPGHKGRNAGKLRNNLTGLDITEIDGYDNLHNPEGILLEAQIRAAKIYGAEESFFLVNGSTCGVLSAISAAAGCGSKILMARNSHKSAYHAAYLNKLDISFLYPEMHRQFAFAEAMEPSIVEETLKRENDVKAVFIVSPTYEGRIADIRAISQIVHARNIPLIVDEAHGAHLGLSPFVAENSNQTGADLVINSVHKTLPALTQTALLHVNGSLVDRDRLKRFLTVYQSSSPSYILMASIDNALRMVENKGAELYGNFFRKFTQMLEKLKVCKNLAFPAMDGKQDLGKLVISSRNRLVTGQWIYDILRKKFHLQLEMASYSYCLAMFTLNDADEAYERMTEACLWLDEKICADNFQKLANLPEEDWMGTGRLMPAVDDEREKDALSFYKAWDMDAEEVLLADAEGRHAGGFVNLYPPGIPYIIPGERITRQNIERTEKYISQGLNVQGVNKLSELSDKLYIKVIKNI